VPPAAPTPVVPPADDRRDIQNLLQRYQAAYSQLSVAALGQLWPGMSAATANRFARSFSQWNSGALELDEQSLKVQGTTATVVAAGTVSFVPKVGKPNSRKIVATFRLEKRGAEWVIESFDAR
jgi:hypothetical protein